jgi:hypothetical protein
MNLRRIESQLSSLERLVPHLTQHGCDISAQDAARTLMRYFDTAELPHDDQALGRAYAELRGPLKDIAEGRSGNLTMGKVAAFTRFCREEMLRAETTMAPPGSVASAVARRLASTRLDS